MFFIHKDIRYAALAHEDISPRVLFCSYHQGMMEPAGKKYMTRFVYDYELELITESSGYMVIEGKTYPINRGDIVFRKPGQLVQGIPPYNCYLVCFDMLGNKDKTLDSYDFLKAQAFQCHYTNPDLDSIPAVYSADAYDKQFHLFDSVLNEYIINSNRSPMLLKMYVLQIINLILDDTSSLKINGNKLSPPFYSIKKVIAYIERNYNRKITLEDMARISNHSPAHFHKLFKKAVGSTPNDYITNLRLNQAKELLIKTDISVYKIANQCGYENIPYFSYDFKKRIGVTPVEFRRRHEYYL